MSDGFPLAVNCLDTATSKLENNWRPVKIKGIMKVKATDNGHIVMCLLVVQHPVRRDEKRLELLPTQYLMEKHRTFLFDYYSSRLRFDLPRGETLHLPPEP